MIIIKNIILLLFISQFMYSQFHDIKFEQVSLKNGLSQSVVLDIVQDASGFLWIATQDGLNKYDGYSFKVYKKIPADSTSLSDNWINTLLIVDDNLWLGTEYGGINKYNFKDDSIERINYNFGKPVRIIKKDKDGNLWIGTWGEGLFKFNPVNGIIKRFTNIPGDKTSLSHNKIRSLFIDKDDNIWVGSALGLNKLEKESEKFIHYFHNPSDPESISNDFIVSIIEDNKNRIWIGTADGLNLFRKNSGKFVHFKNDQSNENTLSDNYIITGFQDEKGSLWFGTLNGGLNKIISLDETPVQSSIKIKRYKNDQLNLNSLSCNYIRKIYQDKNSVMWIGTWGGGLNKFDMKPQKFIYYQPGNNKKNSLSYPYIRSFFKFKNGNLLIGTDGNGLDFFDAAENKFYNYKFKEDDLLDFNYVYTFHEENGTLWIGTFGGLSKISLDKNSEKLKFNHTEFKSNCQKFRKKFEVAHLRTIKSLDKHILLLGTNSGLAEFNAVTNEFRKVNSDKLPSFSVTAIQHDKKNNQYFIGSIQGLYKLKFIQQEKFFLPTEVVHYKNSENVISSLSSDKINCIHIDTKNRIWIGTSLGLNLFNPPSEEFTYFLSANGLPNDIINAILEDKKGDLWISTNNGLSKLTEVNGEFNFRNYDESDGLQSNEFNQASSYLAEDGEMFFGGINGFNRFFPEDVKDNSYKPNLVFTKIKIFNKEIKGRVNKFKKELIISHDENFISFEFSALDFTNPSKNLYKYKMEGFDKDWINSGHTNFASYTNLDPGKYVLKVLGSNNDGIWNTKGEYLILIVTPPYWMTWWFRILVVLFVSGIIFIIYRIRVERIIELERLRTRIASDLHDEVGASLTKISMQAGLANYDSQIQNVKPKLKKIENSSREVISTMSDIVWSIDARNDTIGNLLDRMRDFAFNILSDKHIDFQFKVEGLNEEKKIAVDLRQNIYLIFKEAINNIVKHSCASEILIEMKNLNDQFIMKIVDNGKGLPDVLRENGNGIKNLKMRAGRIKGRIEFVNGNGLTIILTTNKL